MQVHFLDAHFDESRFETSAHVLGKKSSCEDHWCLYVCSSLLSEESNSRGDVTPVKDDHMTLEILMTGLDSKVMHHFWKTKDELCGKSTQSPEDRVSLATLDVPSLYHVSVVDAHVFDPCGYSLNGLLDNQYFTIHVTPEPHCSYASFETTVPESNSADLKALVERVVKAFCPSKFSVSLFTTTRDCENPHLLLLKNAMDKITGVLPMDQVSEETFGQWMLQFGQFECVAPGMKARLAS